MRLLLAALIFLGGVFLITSGIVHLLPDTAPEWATPAAILVSTVLSLILTNLLVNVRGTRFWQLGRARESADDPDQQGLLNSTVFSAKRAFQVNESRDEGSNYFLELIDGSVLFLSGHYFYEHEPLEVDGSIVQRREFPCTEFILRRNDEGRCVAIECRGRVLEPEVVTPPFAGEDLASGTVPKDGDHITSATYDELRTRLMERRRLAH